MSRANRVLKKNSIFIDFQFYVIKYIIVVFSAHCMIQIFFFFFFFFFFLLNRIQEEAFREAAAPIGLDRPLRRESDRRRCFTLWSWKL